MERKCKSCGSLLSKSLGEEQAFLDKIAFRFDDVQFPFPPYEHCSSCRHRHRLAFRNEWSLYHRTSIASERRILSLYHEAPLWGQPYKVMLEEEWRGEHLDPFAYGLTMDFNRPFFEQYAELQNAVPRMSIVNLHNENSPYTSHTGYSKNCYLLPCSEHCEDCYYGRFLQRCKNCVDCTSVYDSELCYECFQVSNCYQCGFLSLSENCSECYFSEALTGCKNCIFCSNLHRAEYQIFNSPVTRNEFHEQLASILSSGKEIEKAVEKWSKIRMERAHRPANIRNCENSSGDFLLDSKNCDNCVDVTSCESCSDVIVGYKLKDCQHCCNLYLDCELDYELLGSTQIYHCAFGFYVFRSQDVLYSEYIYDSKNMFGCVGITRGEYCILNKRYTKPDYEQLARQLVEHMIKTGEWGKPFPAEFSPFGYNETVANDFSPLTQQEATQKGFLWRVQDKRERIQPTRSEPPDLIDDCNDDTLGEVFKCQHSGEPFKIMAPELEFYRRQRYALPKLSPLTRHVRREHLRFPSDFRVAVCAGCSTTVLTNVPPDLDATIHCESCYQANF